MDTVTQLITNIRETYIKGKLKNDVSGYKDNAVSNLKTSVKIPLLGQVNINGEDETFKSDMQNLIETTGVDLITLDKSFTEIAKEADTLLTNTIANINNAKSIAKKAQNVLDNVNKICGYYTSFDTIIAMDENSFTGTYGQVDDNTFCCYINRQSDAALSIVDIKGTGTDLTAESNLIDDDELSYFDYIGADVNKDVNCIAQIKSKSGFSLLKVYTDKALTITSVSVSENGIVFNDILKQEINVKGNDILLNGNYYSLGLLGIPISYYAKIGFTSNEYVRINKLEALAATFDTTANLIGNEITSKNITSIAVYASEYVPESFADGSYFKYILTVNGKDHEVQPINSQRPGTKIIKYKTDGSVEDSVLNITDKITSANLKITMTSPDDTQTPFVSNIKICLGAES